MGFGFWSAYSKGKAYDSHELLMVNGRWSMVNGQWSMDRGLWTIDHWPRTAHALPGALPPCLSAFRG